MNSIVDILQTETGTEAVTLAEAKAHLIIDFDDDNTLLTALIQQCRRAIEQYCGISIINKTVTLTAYIADNWELPYGPVIALISVSTPDGNTGSGPVDYHTTTDGWRVTGEQFKTFSPQGYWSGWRDDHYARFNDWGDGGQLYRLTYTTGYASVPYDLKLAILNEIAYRYENRGDQTVSGLCPTAQALAFPYKRMAWQ